ncbi:hypothetical protein CC80DRAFT_588441 [Byssothecium circinans]|uniref:Uncharacterized protein n=1 Tax=Byssothecium circinans TaxID=147558 RepID=A0A6A5UE20_9PLEO|nr:hypothetical protein CC80DRAFT_588441 [Byssothecium circinans]
MRFDSFTAFLAVSNAFLGASAGPVAAKRQASSSVASSSISASPTPSPSPTKTDSSSSSSTSQLLGALIPTTLSDGTVTTTSVRDPKATDTTTNTATTTRFGDVPLSTEFPICRDTNAKPFCLPSDKSTLYVGKTYYTTWNSDFFPSNSTVQIKVQWANDTKVETWTSENLPNQLGYAAIKMEKEWLQGYTHYNLSFRALNFRLNDPSAKLDAFDGPQITLTYPSPEHYPPSEKTKFNKEGLMIGLPASFGFVCLVVFGLWFGMRKNRTIGLGNIMGRRRGYGTGKSRRQRLGLGKKGAIKLEERETGPQYRDVPRGGHGRGDSLGSLVSDDDIRPAPGRNHFRDEMNRQQTGR